MEGSPFFSKAGVFQIHSSPYVIRNQKCEGKLNHLHITALSVLLFHWSDEKEKKPVSGLRKVIYFCLVLEFNSFLCILQKGFKWIFFFKS